jgi:hypothetical protein
VLLGRGPVALIERFGPPVARSGISGVAGARESLRYTSESGATVTIVLVDGKVTELPR